MISLTVSMTNCDILRLNAKLSVLIHATSSAIWVHMHWAGFLFN